MPVRGIAWLVLRAGPVAKSSSCPYERRASTREWQVLWNLKVWPAMMHSLRLASWMARAWGAVMRASL
eukprot:1341947-Rhodomonas_salina.1